MSMDASHIRTNNKKDKFFQRFGVDVSATSLEYVSKSELLTRVVDFVPNDDYMRFLDVFNKGAFLDSHFKNPDLDVFIAYASIVGDLIYNPQTCVDQVGTAHILLSFLQAFTKYQALPSAASHTKRYCEFQYRLGIKTFSDITEMIAKTLVVERVDLAKANIWYFIGTLPMSERSVFQVKIPVLGNKKFIGMLMKILCAVPMFLCEGHRNLEGDLEYINLRMVSMSLIHFVVKQMSPDHPLECRPRFFVPSNETLLAAHLKYRHPLMVFSPKVKRYPGKIHGVENVLFALMHDLYHYYCAHMMREKEYAVLLQLLKEFMVMRDSYDNERCKKEMQKAIYRLNDMDFLSDSKSLLKSVLDKASFREIFFTKLLDFLNEKCLSEVSDGKGWTTDNSLFGCTFDRLYLDLFRVLNRGDIRQMLKEVDITDLSRIIKGTRNTLSRTGFRRPDCFYLLLEGISSSKFSSNMSDFEVEHFFEVIGREGVALFFKTVDSFSFWGGDENLNEDLKKSVVSYFYSSVAEKRNSSVYKAITEEDLLPSPFEPISDNMLASLMSRQPKRS